MNNFVSLACIFCIFPICVVQTQVCEKRNKLSGEISDSQDIRGTVSKCWTIEVPQDSFVRLNLTTLTFSQTNAQCSQVHVKVIVSGTNETFTYCPQDTHQKPVIALSDVTITYSHHGAYSRSSSFNFYYSIESLICAQKDHFRCSPSACIRQYQVCDGVKDCENGMDEVGCEKGITAVKGINVSRENVTTWLKSQRSTSFGWGKNIHRAITALYLTKAVAFTGQNLEDELMVKQLELQTSVALLRNSTDPVSVSELSMFVNALTVTCHNARNFYGHDLLQILRDRVSVVEPPSPSAYLTLCNSNWTFSEHDVKRLMRPLHNHPKYPFISDVQAVAVMALTCMKKNTHNFRSHTFPTNLYDTTIKKFIGGQLSDGSFGNVYTTALVTQALIASGQENNKAWNVTATAQYLMQRLNSSSIDFLSAYLTLPIFSGRSLVNIAAVNCSNVTRKQEEDNEISDVTNKLGGKVSIHYSLYIGDQKDVIHTIILRVPENSSAYDVMRVAQVADPKYKFLHRDVSGQMYVYEVAGITNDPEAGKFWLLHTWNRNENGTVKHHIESPDEFILGDDEHLIMWYKTADI